MFTTAAELKHSLSLDIKPVAWRITVLLQMNLQALRTNSVALTVLILHVHALKQHLPLVLELQINL